MTDPSVNTTQASPFQIKFRCKATQSFTISNPPPQSFSSDDENPIADLSASLTAVDPTEDYCWDFALEGLPTVTTSALNPISILTSASPALSFKIATPKEKQVGDHTVNFTVKDLLSNADPQSSSIKITIEDDSLSLPESCD